MKTRCKLEHGHQTCTGCPPSPSHGGTGPGAAPHCGRGRGAGGEPHPSHWPHVQAASYLCYHITSSSPSSAGSINGCGCFPQGMSTVGKPRRGGSGLYSSPVLGVLETNGARRVPAASGAAANPGTGCGVSPTPTPIPRHRLGCGGCRSLLRGIRGPEQPSQTSRPPCAPKSPAEPLQHGGGSETTTVTLRGAEGPHRGTVTPAETSAPANVLRDPADACASVVRTPWSKANDQT